MERIVIIGGGFAGLRVLYRLRKVLGSTVDIALIDRSEFSIEKPSLPEVAFAGKEPSKVRIPLKRTVERKWSKFIMEVHPRNVWVFLSLVTLYFHAGCCTDIFKAP